MQCAVTADRPALLLCSSSGPDHLNCYMNTSEGALKAAIHRLRKRYRDLFRQEIADTVANPAEVESELRFLAGVLTGK